jgi:hypothetical protein
MNAMAMLQQLLRFCWVWVQRARSPRASRSRVPARQGQAASSGSAVEIASIIQDQTGPRMSAIWPAGKPVRHRLHATLTQLVYDRAAGNLISMVTGDVSSIIGGAIKAPILIPYQTAEKKRSVGPTPKSVQHGLLACGRNFEQDSAAIRRITGHIAVRISRAVEASRRVPNQNRLGSLAASPTSENNTFSTPVGASLNTVPKLETPPAPVTL